MQEQASNIDWSATAAMISSLVALVAVIIGPIASYYIAKSQISATVLSNERKEWIAELRSELANFMQLMTIIITTIHARWNTQPGMDEFLKIMDKLWLSYYKISLLLDVNNTFQHALDVTIKEVLELIPETFQGPEGFSHIIDKKLEGIKNLSRDVLQDELLGMVKKK